MKRQHFNVKELDIFLSVKVLENTPAVLSLGKLCVQNGYSYEWINGQKPHIIQNGIRIQCNTENFVPIVVPGLSTSSSSSSHHATSRTPSRQKRHHSTSSSRLSSSPTTTVSSDSETREREDQSDIYSPPVLVSSSNVDDRTAKPVVGHETNHEQGRQANQKFPKTNENETTIERRSLLFLPTQVERRCIPIYRSGRKSSKKIWWMIEFLNTEIHTPVLLMKYLWSPHPREVRIWVSTVFTLISIKTEIARSVRGPKLQGPRVEDAMAEPYLMQKILVT